jgi:hypothetical protein
MKRTPLLIAVAIASVGFFACKNSGTSGLPVPKDAAMVLHVNASSLQSKLSWDEIRQTDWFRDYLKEEQDSLNKKIMENPEASGVDIKSDFVLFVKPQGKGGYMAFEGNLKDAAAFEAMLKKSNKDTVTVKSDGDIKYISTGKSVVCWNDKRFITMTDAPYLNQMNPFGGNREEGETAFSADSLRHFGKGLFSLKNDESLNKDDRFNDLVKEAGDVHFWINTDTYTSAMGGGMLSTLKVGSLLQGNIGTFTLNFDNGKVTVNSKQYMNEEMTKLMEKYSSKTVSKDLLNRIPSENVIAVIAMNVDPEGIKAFLKAAGFDGMANSFLGQMNYSLDELIQATRGEFLVAVSDLAVTSREVTEPAYYEGGQPYTYTKKEQDMNVLFASSVNNRASFEKLLNIAQQNMKDDPKMSQVNFKVTDQWFVASNKPGTVDKFLSGSNSKLSFADKISGHPMGIYVDISKILQTTKGKLETASDSLEFEASQKMWQDVVITGGEFKNGVATGKFELNLVDKNTNSLKQINQFGTQMAAARKKRREYYEANNKFDMDSVQMTPPVIAPSE